MGDKFESKRFELRRELGRGGVGVVYEAFDRVTQEQLALKTLHFVNGETLYRFKREFRLVSGLRHPNLVRLRELHGEHGTWFFTMELVEGLPFGKALRAGAASAELVEARLRSALPQLLSALQALHRAGCIHRDVKDTNVLMESSGRVVLVDFGLAERAADASTASRQGPLGTFAYLAPELLSGAVATPAVDLYATGVMLYAALTGELPFRGDLDRLFALKQGPAPDPRARAQQVADDLSELCMALLSPDPDARPSVERALVALGRSPSLTPRLGALSIPIEPIADEAFVGREEQLAALQAALARCEGGRPVSLLVVGEPGAGKTAVCREFLARCARAGRPSLVLAGRCYQQESVPLKAVDEAVDDLSHFLLGLDETACAKLLPRSIHVLARAFPVLYRVPVVSRAAGAGGFALGLSEQRARVFSALKQLLSAVSEILPLIVLIDDLQWADPDSLKLLEDVLSGNDAPRMLLLGTAREDAVEAGPNALSPALLARFAQIRVESLNIRDARSLLQGLVPGEPSLVEELARDAHGHPLFLLELARNWNRSGRRGTTLQALLRRRVERLDDDARRIVQTLAVAGRPLPAELLSESSAMPMERCVDRLRELRAMRLLSATGAEGEQEVQLYHDRLREAVVSSLGEEQARLELALGRAYLDRVAREGNTALFAAAHHLTRALPGLSVDERRRLVEVLSDAARACLTSVAYDAARGYVERALELLSEDGWQSERERRLSLSHIHIDVLLSQGRIEEARAVYHEALLHTKTARESVALHTQMVERCTVQGRFEEALTVARVALRQLGSSISKRGSQLGVLREVALLRWHMRGKAPEQVTELPVLADERHELVTEVLMSAAPAAFFADAALLSEMAIRMARNSARDGLTDVSAYAFMTYAAILTGAFGDYAMANRFADAAWELNARFGNEALTPKLCFVGGLYVRSWSQPFVDTLALFERGIEAGQKHRDPAYECYNAFGIGHVLWLAARSLTEVEDACHAFLGNARYLEDSDMVAATRARLRACRVLRTTSPRERESLLAEGSSLVTPLSDDRTPVALFSFHLYEAITSYLFGEYERAQGHIEEAAQRQLAQFGIPTLADLAMYRALIAAARSEGRPRKLLSVCKSSVRTLGPMARHAPHNFAARHLLAQGALAEARAQWTAARIRYAEAAEVAEGHEQYGLCAVAFDASARVCARAALEADGIRPRDLARQAFARWGANGKAEPTLVPPQSRSLAPDTQCR